MPAVDFSQWPVWLILLLVLVNTFKDQIGAFIPTAIHDHFGHQAKRQTDREEFEQEIKQLMLDSLVQNDAAEQLRSSHREEMLMETIQINNEWIREVLDKRLESLNIHAEAMTGELIKLRHGTERTNNLLTTIHIALSALAERVDAS